MRHCSALMFIEYPSEEGALAIMRAKLYTSVHRHVYSLDRM